MTMEKAATRKCSGFFYTYVLVNRRREDGYTRKNFNVEKTDEKSQY